MTRLNVGKLELHPEMVLAIPFFSQHLAVGDRLGNHEIEPLITMGELHVPARIS
jgi:hypothetical protein